MTYRPKVFIPNLKDLTESSHILQDLETRTSEEHPATFIQAPLTGYLQDLRRKDLLKDQDFCKIKG
jgi:hypothetical protein